MTELIKQGYIGNPAQLVTLRRVTVAEGKAKGTGIIEVRTAGGLELDLLPDAGLDIGQCRFRGVNMSWMSKNGYDSPAAIAPYENEFVNTFPGGLLYTCGLRSAGPANRDGGEWHPLHGRYHSLHFGTGDCHGRFRDLLLARQSRHPGGAGADDLALLPEPGAFSIV